MDKMKEGQGLGCCDVGDSLDRAILVPAGDRQIGGCTSFKTLVTNLEGLGCFLATKLKEEKSSVGANSYILP